MLGMRPRVVLQMHVLPQVMSKDMTLHPDDQRLEVHLLTCPRSIVL